MPVATIGQIISIQDTHCAKFAGNTIIRSKTRLRFPPHYLEDICVYRTMSRSEFYQRFCSISSHPFHTLNNSTKVFNLHFTANVRGLFGMPLSSRVWFCLTYYRSSLVRLISVGSRAVSPFASLSVSYVNLSRKLSYLLTSNIARNVTHAVNNIILRWSWRGIKIHAISAVKLNGRPQLTLFQEALFRH